MPKTVTIEVSDERVPTLERVLKRWSYRNTDEITLQHVLHHGLEMMDMPGPPERREGDPGDDLPF